MDANQLGNQILFGVLFIIGGGIGVFVWVSAISGKTSSGSAIPGTLTIRKHKYSYELGDLLLRFGGASTFSGMDIHIPKMLPHIFLDASANDRQGRSPYIFDNDDRVSLEGDFDQHFRAYAPKEHKQLALSVLSPDVLYTLLSTAYEYDVEIMEDHVRLIVPGGAPISRNSRVKDDLLKAAQAVMKEIDHRLQSWQESSLTGDTALDVVRGPRD